MKVWIDPPSVDVPERLQSAVGGHSLVTRTLVQRGFAEPEAALAFLDPCRYQPASPFVMPNMDRATERVGKAIQRGEPITVWGDFDVDGQTSTTLLVSTLQDLGGGGPVLHSPPSKRVTRCQHPGAGKDYC